MEKAFQELLRLIGEARRGKECGCSVTMIAYLKMAEAATFELLKYANNGKERDKLLAACNYSYQFCLRQKKWRHVLAFMSQFWDGVDDGFFERTWPNRNTYYDRGYMLGAFGETEKEQS